MPACFRPNMRSPNDKLTTIDNRNYFPMEFYKSLAAASKKQGSNAKGSRKMKQLTKIINEDAEDGGDEEDEEGENNNFNQRSNNNFNSVILGNDNQRAFSDIFNLRNEGNAD